MPPSISRAAALCVLACAALLGGCATVGEGDTLAGLVARHTAAMGGRAAIEATQSLEFRMQIVEPTFEVEGIYVVDRRGRMRVDIFDQGKRVFTEAFDGHDAWQMAHDGTVRSSSAAGKAALWHGTQFPGKLLGLHEMAAHGHRLELVGDERIDGVAWHVIRLTFSDGFETYLYINPKTFLIERQRDVRALHPDADPTEKWVEYEHGDFRPVAGVLHPWFSRQVDLRTHVTVQTTRLLGVRANVPVDDSIFRRPAPGAG